MRVTIKYKIDSFGNCSDGTNMYDWSNERLKQVIDTCWYASISDLARKILKSRKNSEMKLITLSNKHL
jgi:hypothetical protein